MLAAQTSTSIGAKIGIKTITAVHSQLSLLGQHRKSSMRANVFRFAPARWGISRTVAQIHALPYSRSALSAEEIADAFSVARCKVSISLKEL